MLYKSEVNPELLRLLEQLMQIDAFSNLRLVGGTALALQIGHRESVDIDLFGKIDFENQEKNIEINGKMEFLKKSKNINVFSIDNIKIDIVNYKYPWISELVKKSLTYFDDAEPEPMPVMKENINWQEIKEYLQKNILPLI